MDDLEELVRFALNIRLVRDKPFLCGLQAFFWQATSAEAAGLRAVALL